MAWVASLTSARLEGEPSLIASFRAVFHCTATDAKKHYLALFEAKNELTSSGCATAQLGAYYCQHVARRMFVEGDMPLVAVAGPAIHVSAALTRSHPQIDDLTGIQRLVLQVCDPKDFDL